MSTSIDRIASGTMWMAKLLVEEPDALMRARPGLWEPWEGNDPGPPGPTARRWGIAAEAKGCIHAVYANIPVDVLGCWGRDVKESVCEQKEGFLQSAVRSLPKTTNDGLSTLP